MSSKNQSIDLINMVTDIYDNNTEEVTISKGLEMTVLPPSELWADMTCSNLYLPPDQNLRICKRFQWSNDMERMKNFPYGYSIWDTHIRQFNDKEYEPYQRVNINFHQCDLVILIGKFSHYRDHKGRVIKKAYIGTENED